MVLEVIAALKLVQAAGLFFMGFGALGLLKAGRADALEQWLEQLSLSEGHRIAASLAGDGLHLLQGATPRKIMVAAMGFFIYGGIFIVEAVGLWRLKRWAEYLTIFVTSSLLPFEIFAVWREVTVVRVGAVILNTVVVAYLAWQLYATKGKHGPLSPRTGL
ncbi:MAG: DUF2127 domain-containing protein [Gemmatimonadaceae bacterium]|nr:DUF2127 domain-containing protein [Gemmatimonadaceae bacterium]